jgi:hypothetical protein
MHCNMASGDTTMMSKSGASGLGDLEASTQGFARREA